jgi:hypothetical protein
MWDVQVFIHKFSTWVLTLQSQNNQTYIPKVKNNSPSSFGQRNSNVHLLRSCFLHSPLTILQLQPIYFKTYAQST